MATTAWVRSPRAPRPCLLTRRLQHRPNPRPSPGTRPGRRSPYLPSPCRHKHGWILPDAVGGIDRRGVCRAASIQDAGGGTQGSGFGGEGHGGLPAPLVAPTRSPSAFLAFSSTFYAGLTAVAVLLGEFNGGMHIHKELLPPFEMSGALVWGVPIIVLMLGAARAAEHLEPMQEIKCVIQRTLLPTLKKLPQWGLAVVALGAGVGEEAFFRAFLQTSLIALLVNAMGHSWGAACGIAISSVVFGLLHALTPFYFAWATAAGTLLGIEYLHCGLAVTAATHFVYDWLAFLYILKYWGAKSENEGPDQGSPAIKGENGQVVR
eukprot:evm.model.scf_2730.1 EVM.evm.TU.scf_2730.1   scf_2730:11379-15750(-)